MFAVNKKQTQQFPIDMLNILKIISDIEGHLDDSSLKHLQNIVLIIPEIMKKNSIKYKIQSDRVSKHYLTLYRIIMPVPR